MRHTQLFSQAQMEEIHKQELCTKVPDIESKILSVTITVDKRWPHKFSNSIIKSFPNAIVRQHNWRTSEEDKIPERLLAKSLS